MKLIRVCWNFVVVTSAKNRLTPRVWLTFKYVKSSNVKTGASLWCVSRLQFGLQCFGQKCQGPEIDNVIIDLRLTTAAFKLASQHCQWDWVSSRFSFTQTVLTCVTTVVLKIFSMRMGSFFFQVHTRFRQIPYPKTGKNSLLFYGAHGFLKFDSE